MLTSYIFILTESSQGSNTADDRLSPIPTPSTLSSSNSNSPVKTSPVKSLPRPQSASNIEKTETKSRWKRRKTSNAEVPEKFVTETQEDKFEITEDTKVDIESDIIDGKSVEKVDESGFDEEFTSQSLSPVKAEPSVTSVER